MAKHGARSVVMKISESAVIGRILEVVKAFPEVAEKLPAEAGGRGFWAKAFAKNAATKRLMATFQEIPMFTCLAPAGASRAAWLKVFEPQHSIRTHITLPNFESHLLVKGVPTTLIHLAGCFQQVVREATRKPAVRKPVKRWRDRFGPQETIQRVRPKESDAYVHNPHRGTTTFQQFQGDEPYRNWHTSDMHGPTVFNKVKVVEDNLKYIPRTTLTYCRWPWRFIEPKKGKFNWKLIDDTLKAAHDRGQTVQIRFQPFTSHMDYADEPIHAKRHPPERSVNVPDWYWDTGAKWLTKGVYAEHEPDSNDPKYLQHFGNFILAFGRRYDGHPDLESIDMAYAGFWGESGGNSTPKTAQKLVDYYMRAFKKTTLLSMLGTPGCTYAEKKAREKNHPIGWRADCFGDLRSVDVPEVPRDLCFNHTYDQYPKEIERNGLVDRWKTAPVTMETCGNVATWFLSGHDLDFMIEEGYRYHMSVFMPKNAFMPEAWMPKLIEFDKKIGYRFVLRQSKLPLEMKPGVKAPIEFFIENIGCAPIYRPYPLAIRFRQGKNCKIVHLREDIRGWQPGQRWFEEEIALPNGFKKGEVKVDLAIVDAFDQPKVWFAIEGEPVDGWHPLTSIDRV
ncbi:MAG TPA: DUF4832 domain-containing protein [Planctomycetota bacterium]|nr:DUF4832 domain-containing protein [Planctomycetota bacterium]